METNAPSGIELETKFFFLSFLLLLVKPRVVIDNGQPVPVAWGTVPIPVAPGRHQVRVWFPWLFFSHAGDSTVVVDVPPGGVVGVRWNAPWVVFLAGKFTVLGVRSATASLAPQAAVAPPTAAQPAAAVPVAPSPPTQPAGWFPDPSGRHQLRYWDGAAWSPHVSDNGVTATG